MSVRSTVAWWVFYGTAAACASAGPPRAPADQWPPALEAAQRTAQDGNYAVADSLLQALGHRFSGTVEAREIGYWRAVYALDPANRNAAPATAVALLDAYLADTAHADHRAEAIVFRHATVTMDSLRRAAADLARATDSLRAVVDSSRAALVGRDARDRTREEELQRLKEQCDKTAAELDRIKRRLAAPRP